MNYITFKNVSFLIFDLFMAMLGVIIAGHIMNLDFWDSLFLMAATLLFGFGIFNLISHLIRWIKAYRLKKLIHRLGKKE